MKAKPLIAIGFTALLLVACSKSKEEINKDISEQKTKINYCSKATDCAEATLACGCIFLYNRNENPSVVQELDKKILEQGGPCPMCLPAKSTECQSSTCEFVL